MLQKAWRLPLRKLVAGDAADLRDRRAGRRTALDRPRLDASASCVGALLSPTDPVLSSSVVTNPRVPRVVRHSLNLESGLNDGLALPAVLAFTRGAGRRRQDFVWWQLRAPGRDARLRVRDRRWASLASPADAARRGSRASRRTSSRCTRSASRSRPTASTVAAAARATG